MDKERWDFEMIYDMIDNTGKYFNEGDKFNRAIRYAVEFDLNKPDGDYEVDGKNIIARVQSYQTSPAEERKFEDHKLYADVQIMRQGSERQDVVVAEKLNPQGPYNDQKDVTKYDAPDVFTSLALHPGQFVVYYPDDIHRPNCNIGSTSKKVRKICMKVKL